MVLYEKINVMMLIFRGTEKVNNMSRAMAISEGYSLDPFSLVLVYMLNTNYQNHAF